MASVRMRFLNTHIDNVTFDEAVDIIDEMVSSGNGGYIVTPNVDHIVQLETDEKLRRIYEGASLIITDGKPLIWISRLQKRPIKEKISGSDMFFRLCALSAKKGYRLFFLGGKEGVAQKARERLEEDYPGINICGCYAPAVGFESDEAEVKSIISIVKAAKTDILVVCLGAPKQEYFIYDNREALKGIVCCGFGASLDFAAGIIRRAPVWMQKSGLEWLYRLCHEPGRLAGRYLGRDLKIFAIAHKYRKAGDDS